METSLKVKRDANDSRCSLDSYLTVVPSGLESTTKSSIINALSDFTCQIKQLNSQVSQEKIDNIATKLTKQREKKKAKMRKRQIKLHPIYDEKIFGTCKAETGKEVNIGFHNDRSVISTPGGLEGKSLIQFDTDAPPEMVASIREMGCGPLMALVVSSCDKIIGNEDTVEESVSSLYSFLDSFSNNDETYQNKFEIALNLWFRHAESVWFRSRDVEDYLQSHGTNKYRKRQHEALDNHTNNNKPIPKVASYTSTKGALDDLCRKREGINQMKYRVSCIRAFTKEYKYKRDELTPHLATILIPKSNAKGKDKVNGFSVDLVNYDFEVVVMIHDDIVSVAIALNYYQYVGAKSFCSGTIPPDISMPYIKGEISKDIIRLRPAIASLLFNLCDIKTGDIVLDPCAGVGTIPIEGSLKGFYAVGGDLALNSSDLGSIASAYSERARNYQVQHGYIGSSDIMSWDASLLPIRDASVDIIISDLPFGMRCLSSHKLKSFLPLLLAECGRCLRPSGQMTLLCGSFQGVLEAVQELDSMNDSSMFAGPTSIFPVNIGGLSAWIIQIKRTHEVVSFTQLRNRIRKMVTGRSQSMQGTKKRTQA